MRILDDASRQRELEKLNVLVVAVVVVVVVAAAADDDRESRYEGYSSVLSEPAKEAKQRLKPKAGDSQSSPPPPTETWTEQCWLEHHVVPAFPPLEPPSSVPEALRSSFVPSRYRRAAAPSCGAGLETEFGSRRRGQTDWNFSG